LDDHDDEAFNGAGGCAEHCRRSKGKYANGAPFLLLLVAFLTIPVVLLVLDLRDRRRRLRGRTDTERGSRSLSGRRYGYVGARPVSSALEEESWDGADEIVGHVKGAGVGRRAADVGGASPRL
jgi:hypothetical protein